MNYSWIKKLGAAQISSVAALGSCFAMAVGVGLYDPYPKITAASHPAPVPPAAEEDVPLKPLTEPMKKCLRIGIATSTATQSVNIFTMQCA